MEITEAFCCCLDVATGSLLSGIYSCLLALIFIAIGVDSLVEASKNTHDRDDLTALNALYGTLIVLSALYGVFSISLVLGASRKLKLYVAPWLLVAPFWTLVALCTLVVAPKTMPSSAVKLSSFSSRLAGTIVIIIVNIFCYVCVCLHMSTLIRDPLQKLRSTGVVDALETGFSNGYSRLRESIRRPAKSKSAVKYQNQETASERPEVSISDRNAPVVLNPYNLEVKRPDKSASSAPGRGSAPNKQNIQGDNGGDDWHQALSQAEQLDIPHNPDGVVNPGYRTDF